MFCLCRCMYTRNIYLKCLDRHIEYIDESVFRKTYRKVLQDHGITEETQQKELIADIETEIERRRNLVQESLRRQTIIRQTYTRLHPSIYSLQETFLSAKFLELVSYCRRVDATFEGTFDYLTQTDAERTYTLPVFTAEFCKLFLEEIVNFENSSCPKGRPNTMNNYGVLLEELGFTNFISALREQYLQPITSLLYPDWGGSNLDSHKAFIVQYKTDEDLDLSYHFDNAEVTLNVALSPESSYADGDLYFGAMRTVDHDPVGDRKTVKHVPTMGLLHRGQHKHGASAITSGARYNLIIWMRASAVRNKKCPMCDRVPELEETKGFGAGFTRPSVQVCSIE